MFDGEVFLTRSRLTEFPSLRTTPRVFPPFNFGVPVSVVVLPLVTVWVSRLVASAESSDRVIPGLTLDIPTSRRNAPPEVRLRKLRNAMVLRERPTHAQMCVLALARRWSRLAVDTCILHFIFLILTNVALVLIDLICLPSTLTT